MDAGVHVGCAPSVKCALKMEPASAPTAFQSVPLKRVGPMGAAVSAVRVTLALPAPRPASASPRAYRIAPGKAVATMDAGAHAGVVFRTRIARRVSALPTAPRNARERAVDPTDAAEHAVDVQRD